MKISLANRYLCQWPIKHGDYRIEYSPRKGRSAHDAVLAFSSYLSETERLKMKALVPLVKMYQNEKKESKWQVTN